MSRYVVTEDTIIMPDRLRLALIEATTGDTRAMLEEMIPSAALRDKNRLAQTDSAESAQALRSALALELDGLLPTLAVKSPFLPSQARTLLDACAGRAPVVNDRVYLPRQRVEVALGEVDALDVDDAPTFAGLTLRDLHDPYVNHRILADIAKSDGRTLDELVGEFGSIAATANAYGLVWADWFSDVVG
jgi:hypothetical protein